VVKMEQTENFWKRCSACKKAIAFRGKYFVCSVSTCQGLRTGYAFCSVPCWDSHVPGARHRDAGAIERTAPATAESQAVASVVPPTIVKQTETGGVRRVVGQAPPRSQIPKEILIVASKLKDYIRLRSEMNTSQNVMEVLSDQVRVLCDNAIDRAREEGRKTVLDRDFLPKRD
jgi:hypothetical protein